jgi:hypothetical protein
MSQNNVLNDFNSLPPEAQKQVMDFIAFLRLHYGEKGRNKTKVKPRLVDESFIGIWRDREDMQDSSAWVRKIRAGEWG